MASILDIEDILSDKTTQEIVIKDWYWNEFLPKIDKDNIKNDYRLVYQSFTIAEFMYLPYDITDERWNWLIENQIVVKDHFSCEDKSNLEKWLYENMHSTVYKDNIVKYAFSDKFFEDYQKNVRERRAFAAIEEWIHYMGRSPHKLYYQDKIINDLKNVWQNAWPRSYEPII